MNGQCAQLIGVAWIDVAALALFLSVAVPIALCAVGALREVREAIKRINRH